MTAEEVKCARLVAEAAHTFARVAARMKAPMLTEPGWVGWPHRPVSPLGDGRYLVRARPFDHTRDA